METGTDAPMEGSLEGQENLSETEGSVESPAPIEYTDFNLPEGVTKDDFGPDILDWFAKGQKERQRTQEQAQATLDSNFEMLDQLVKRNQEVHKAWAQESANLGYNSQENTQLIRKALSSVSPSGRLQKELVQNGMQWIPELRKLLIQHGQGLQQDRSMASPGDPVKPGDKRDTMDKLFSAIEKEKKRN